MSRIERTSGLMRIAGTIRNYKVTRKSANFVFTDGDKTRLGVVAIAAGVAGLSGQSISAASNVSAEEEADYVEFDLDGRQVKGWVWRSPFNEGDQVEVAAEFHEEHYEAGGIVRPSDRTIALYPHCSRGMSGHIGNSAKWWFIGVSVLCIFFLLAGLSITGIKNFTAEFSGGLVWGVLGFYIFFGIAAISMARKWMVFVRLAEKVFRTLDLPNPSSIDLVKSSKAQRKPDDPGEFGTFYFRY